MSLRYRIYGNDGAGGAIDYSAPLADVDTLTWDTAALTAGAWRFGVRALFEADAGKYDFGTATSPVATGYTAVTASTTYTEALGYGWSAGTINQVDRANSAGALDQDINYTTDGTFRVDLDDGDYEITIRLGDTASGSHDDVGIFLQGTQVDTVTTPATTVEAFTYSFTVTDGKLLFRIQDQGGTDPNAVITGLSIVRIQEEMNVDAVVEIEIEETTLDDVTAVPAAPIGLTVVATAGGGVHVAWFAPRDQTGGTAAAGYDVFLGAGVATPDYTTAVKTVAAHGLGDPRYAVDLTGLTDGTTYAVGVRAYSAADLQEQNTVVVKVTADATAPANVQRLTAT